MQVAYCSDLHVDFFCRETNPQHKHYELHLHEYVNKVLRPTPADVLIIAGDIGHFNQQNIDLLKILKAYYPEVLITYGNHDAYCISNSQKERYNYQSINRVNEFKQMCLESNIHLLDGSVVTVADKTFAGLPMWYNLPTVEAIHRWVKSLNDANHIIDGYRLPAWMYGKEFIPFDTQAFYLSQVAKLKALPPTDILFSHVCPSIIPLASKDPRYGSTSYDIFYESDNAHLVKAPICIFGHTHNRTTFTNNSTTYLCNPIGYPVEHLYTTIETITI